MQIKGHGTGCNLPRGFTVLELMVTVSIAAILLVAGIPSFQDFNRQQLMKAALANLQNDLMMGRSEAVHLNTRIVSCPGTPEEGCTGDRDWSKGWIVFADSNADRSRQPSETLVRHGQGFENMKISGTTGRTDIRFHPDGSSPGSNGSITFCGLGGPERARKLVISNLGRVRRDSAQGTDTDNCPSKA